jgi:hypothetical protein
MQKEIEITEINNLLESDKNFVDLHSVLNVGNIPIAGLNLMSNN